MNFTPQENLFLAIETTTDIFSIAIGAKNNIIAQNKIPGKKHSEKLIPEIKKILKKADISIDDIKAVAVGTGPGSFTGIRIGLSCAITIAQVKDIPIYGFSSMDTQGKKISNPAIKAFRNKYYYAKYNKKGQRQTPFKIIDRKEKQNLNARLIEVSASDLLKEAAQIYPEKGDWKNIQPIYVMHTEYKPKK